MDVLESLPASSGIDVFVSYEHSDRDRVVMLVNELRRHGLVVWWDQDVPVGAPWEASIEQALDAARVCLVVWSTRSVASENVKAEARRARGHGKLVQAFAEQCEPPLFFGDRPGFNIEDWISGNDRESIHPLLVRLSGHTNAVLLRRDSIRSRWFRRLRIGSLYAAVFLSGVGSGWYLKGASNVDRIAPTSINSARVSSASSTDRSDVPGYVDVFGRSVVRGTQGAPVTFMSMFKPGDQCADQTVSFLRSAQKWMSRVLESSVIVVLFYSGDSDRTKNDLRHRAIELGPSYYVVSTHSRSASVPEALQQLGIYRKAREPFAPEVRRDMSHALFYLDRDRNMLLPPSAPGERLEDIVTRTLFAVVQLEPASMTPDARRHIVTAANLDNVSWSPKIGQVAKRGSHP